MTIEEALTAQARVQATGLVGSLVRYRDDSYGVRVSADGQPAGPNDDPHLELRSTAEADRWARNVGKADKE
jgi:hypothetical protein